MTFCKTVAKELSDHFCCVLQQGQPADPAMPTAVPAYIDSHTDHKNTFTREFTPEEVCTRLHRCSNTASGSNGKSYAQWKKSDRGSYALNTVFSAIHRLGYLGLHVS